MSKQATSKKRAALRQRVEDICTGAIGGYWEREDHYFTPTQLSRIVPALRAEFSDDQLSHDHLFGPHMLKYYEDLDSIVNHLFERAVRA